MSLPQQASQFLSLLSVRRSSYALSKTPSILTSDQIHTILSKILRESPSSFNSKSPRLVLLLGAEQRRVLVIHRSHCALLCYQVCGGDEKAFQGALGRLELFKPALGTVLFFESQAVVEGQQKNIPQYADNFPVWSEHASAIAQSNTWVALTNAGYGANLQHYGNLTQDALKSKYDLPNDWKLRAELVFGAKKEEPKPKEYDEDKENAERLKVFWCLGCGEAVR